VPSKHKKPNINGLAVTYRLAAELRPHPQNPKTHSSKQIGLVIRSIENFGWTNPILVDEDGNVIAGHCRLEAAKRMGIKEVPTICLSNMTAAQKRAYIIADNRLTEVAGSWDRDLLALEHEAIKLLDSDFDLTLTGFDEDEILILSDSLLEGREDVVPEPDRTKPAVSQVGDLWVLGEHRLLCGDALKAESFERLLEGEKAQICIVDGPYNIAVNGHVSGSGKHPEFVNGSGEMSPDEFTGFLTQAFANLIAFSQDGSIHYLFMDWRHLDEMVAATRQYAELKNLIVWNKHSAGLGSFYRSKHELIWVMKNGRGRHINNFGLGEKGRHRTNVWDYPGLSGWTPGREAQLEMHPTVKPVAMIADALKDCSRKGGIVLDCFGGSGTTLIAAEQTKRRARLIELDPAYVDVTIARWQSDTGGKAILSDNGLPFDSVKRKDR
jgi:DNA modification methylase